MDQIKIGKFIAQCRKEKKLTQAQLAEQLNITDRAVSKWETGKGMPDASIMIELCEILGICVNELFSGERVKMEDFNKKADENLIELKMRNEALNKAARFGFGIAQILLLVVLYSIFMCMEYRKQLQCLHLSSVKHFLWFGY